MREYRYRFDAMSTPCELIVFSQDKSRSDKTATSILQETKRIEKKFNYYDRDSYLSALNLRSENRLDQETKSLISRAVRYYNKTDKIFDITSATIKKQLTANTSYEEFEKIKTDFLDYTGCEHISIKKNKLYFDNPHTVIDLGGFAKEYAVDRAAYLLKKQKIDIGLVNFGGDIFALGEKPDGSKFKIGIKNPRNKHESIMNIDIKNQALTTSADYERDIKLTDRTISHIISKKPTNIPPLSVTVISDSCVESGVYSTSLMIDKNLKTDLEKYIIERR